MAYLSQWRQMHAHLFLAGTEVISEVFLLGRSGHRDLIFKYYPNGGVIERGGNGNVLDLDLRVTWLADGSLQLRVGILEDVVYKVERIDNIPIRIDIGKNIADERSH